MVDPKSAFQVFVGASFLISEKRQALADHLRSSSGGDVATEVVRLSEADFARVLVRARELPFAASFQILRVCDARKMKEADLRLLEVYLDKPSPATVLLFEDDALEKSHPLAELASKLGRIFFLDAEGLEAGMRLVQKKLKAASVTIAPGALERLSASASAAPELLETLADQLIAYAGEKKNISEQMASVFEERFEQLNIFKLTDALIQKDRAAAVLLTEKIIREGEQELYNLVGFLHSQLKRLWRVQALLADGLGESEALAKCKISPKQAHFVRRQLRMVPRERLETMIEGLFQLDWKIKTGRAAGFPELEAWLVQATA